MAVIMSHVFDYENELNDNLYNMKMAGDNNNNNNSNINNNNKKTRNANRRVRKLLKPLLSLLKKKSYKLATKNHKNVVSQSEIFTEEVDNQNNSNEALEQRLIADLENAEEGAAITVCLDGQMTVVPVVPGQCYVPVHFAHTHAGDFYWTTLALADSDLCYKERAFSQNQLPEMQVA
ncbi:hypothetical protein PV326_007962 [Microctonus aethiopoides]|nr:hypothetical protein PV326_007962 [Microctonus aethiopoides]